MINEPPHMDMITTTKKSTNYWKRGYSNEIDQTIISYSDSLRGTNNIGDARLKIISVVRIILVA